ncbi:MAG: hypothetical protein JXA09_07765 [Anaerolineae bacterium]|nr:hypothetical protein [Anaerolineae bacterium]
MTEQAAYEIRVQGWIAERWSSWLGDMAIACEYGEDGRPVTIVSGVVPDQAALRGVLNQLWDLNLALISVTRTRVSHSSAGCAE